MGAFEKADSLELIKAQLDAVFNSSYDGIYITDGNGVFLNVNNGLERITGLQKELLIGQTSRSLVDKGIIDHSVVERVIRRKERCTINQTIQGESTKEVMVTATPIFNEANDIVFVVANLRDMTDLIRLEDECNRARSLSERYHSQLMLARTLEEEIISESDEMKQLLEVAYRVALVDSSILLHGESGTGKEVIARYIHSAGTGDSTPFININCASVPEHLLEAEFFGYEGGAFTGSKKEGKIGLFELAEGGTIFHDEINSLPLSLQGKLLRVLETHEIVRVGGTHIQKIDFRVIAASNESLGALALAGQFRQDLFFRLNVIPLTIPPLRDRKRDILPLVRHFLKYYNKKHNQNKEILAATLDELERYDWPGNVRELKNLIERLVVLSPKDVIRPEDLPGEFLTHEKSNTQYAIKIHKIVPLDEIISDVERKLFTLVQSENHSTREAAKLLGISQSTVIRHIKKVSREQE